MTEFAPNRAQRAALDVVALAALLLGAACSDRAMAPDDELPVVVEVTPATVDLQPGDTVRLQATVRNANGEVVPDRPVAWSSSASDVAVVEDGLVTAVAVGEATVTAAAGADSASMSVHVGPAVLVGAGDIASCGSSGDEATAALLDTIPGVVFTAGDNAYGHGTAQQFADCYDPSWGRHRQRTRPSPGNHDYGSPGALPYFEYFGANAGEPGKGYYSYELGGWHVVVLNSELSVAAGSAQESWLRADLAAHPVACTIAYWHHPLFSSGPHGGRASMRPLWDALHEAGADVVINGHDHLYERFAPQAPDGTADPEHGIREFVVGTGGYSHYGVATVSANSEVRHSDTFGVLKLMLEPDRYAWEFVPAAGGSFTDTGTEACR